MGSLCENRILGSSITTLNAESRTARMPGLIATSSMTIAQPELREHDGAPAALACGSTTIALGTITEPLTGDLAKVPPVVVADTSHWLEHNKHLAERPVAH